MHRQLKQRWDQCSIFWKVYVLFVLFVGSIVGAGEFFEDLFGTWLYGAQGLSEQQELCIWLVATFIPTALGSYLFTHLFIGPLRRLTTVTTQLSQGNMQVRADAKDTLRGDEIGILTRSFNHMAERLAHAFENEHQLLAAISHELRSPLTRLSIAVALLRRQKADEQYLQRLELETERMDTLISQLIDYARRETESQSFKQLNLLSIIEDVAIDAIFEGKQAHKTVRLGLPEHAELYGNRFLLRQAIDNVVRNALRYSAPGGVVDIVLTYPGCEVREVAPVAREGQGEAAAFVHGLTTPCIPDATAPCIPDATAFEIQGTEFGSLGNNGVKAYRLHVRDYGPGVPEETLDDLFRPFFRVDAARDRTSGGTGMGLCIVEQAVRLHHGQVRAFNAAGGGLEVVVQLPKNLL